MNLGLLKERCHHCGTQVHPDCSICPECGRTSRDVDVERLALLIDGGDPDDAVRAFEKHGCPDVGSATVLWIALCSSDSVIVLAAAQALVLTQNACVLREMIVSQGTRRWLGREILQNYTRSGHGTTSMTGIIDRAFASKDDAHFNALQTQVGNSDARVREAVADLLRHQPADRAHRPLLEMLRRDRDPAVRARAAHSLGLLGDSALAEHLVRALEDEVSVVRRQAAQALGRMGRGVTQAVIGVMEGGSPEAAFYAARILGQWANSDAIHALINAIGGRRGFFRMIAEGSLLEVGPGAIVPLLEALIRHSDSSDIRDGIVYVLSTMMMPEAHRLIISPVVEAAERVNAALEAPGAAYEALGKLQGVTVEELQMRLTGTLSRTHE